MLQIALWFIVSLWTSSEAHLKDKGTTAVLRESSRDAIRNLTETVLGNKRIAVIRSEEDNLLGNVGMLVYERSKSIDPTAVQAYIVESMRSLDMLDRIGTSTVLTLVEREPFLPSLAASKDFRFGEQITETTATKNFHYSIEMTDFRNACSCTTINQINVNKFQGRTQ